MNHFKKIIALAVCVLVISACAANKNKNITQQNEANAQDVANTSDVTTPPNSLENSVDAIEESNPDETVSFEEWKRKQAEKDKPK